MSPTTLRRLLIGAVVAVCVVIVFLAGTGTAPPPQSATTVPRTTVPWVDRTTPTDDGLEPSFLEGRVASLQSWLVENRGLPFLRPLDVKVFDEHGRDALAQELQDGKDYEWPSYGLVAPLFGVEWGPDDWWGLWALSDSVVIPIEVGDTITSENLVQSMLPSLTDQHYRHRERMDALIRSGLIGDELDALRTLVVGDASFTASGLAWELATGSEWIPAAGGCLSPRTLGFNSNWGAGNSYVCGLYVEGGWDRVNEAYADPPQSTAEILGIQCAVEDTPLTPIDWPVRFEASRGPIWLNIMLNQLGGDISGISGWCADHQRVLGDGGLQFLVMEIWLGSSDDAVIVERETREFFAAARQLVRGSRGVESLVVRDGSWVGIASTISTIDLCSQLPGWCP
ncbi:MAG: hypothetical protein WEE36_06770 [Acidimicrobiia bacterium]